MRKLYRILGLILAIILVFPLGAFLYMSGTGFYQTRNLRSLAKQVKKTEWQDYSYNIFSNSAVSVTGIFNAEIWGPNNIYLRLGPMNREDPLEEAVVFQLNDIRICTNGFTNFVDFVEGQTGEKNLTFTKALLRMDSAYVSHKTQLEKSRLSGFPREFYDNKVKQNFTEYYTEDCKSEYGHLIPERTKNTIKYH